MYNFSNKTLVLTGANGGIGREVAKTFYEDGANLLLADTDKTKLEEFLHSINADDSRVATIAVDVANPDDNDRLIELAKIRYGTVDFVVPCAGIYPALSFEKMDDEQWHHVISINLDGVFYLLRRIVNLLGDNSSIVNLSSVAAFRGAQINTHYAATKGALVSLTKSLAKELGPRTRVNAVAPGIIETAMTKDLLKTRAEESINSSALKRLGKPNEIATVIAFLCSDAASFITGETIHVNGGIYMG